MNREKKIPENDEHVEEEKNYAFGKKFKYTLDSDEEDDEVDEEKYNVMGEDDIEGIEKTTIEFDGNIKITPFNMDEELETGHFDTEGTYIFKKENDIRDNWLDNIDWNIVSKPSEVVDKKQTNEESSGDENDNNNLWDVNTKELYEQIIELIQPEETIRKAIQRYGKQCNTNRKNQKRKFNSKEAKKSFNENNNESNEAKEKMLKLISIADRILHRGDMDIYERTYEQFQLHLNKAKASMKQSSNFDMFSDDFDDAKASSFTLKSSSLLDNSKTQWEYKWEDKEDSKIYGPYSSEEMLAWVNQGYFDNGVFVRRTDSLDTKFYSSKRIDFELYI